MVLIVQLDKGIHAMLLGGKSCLLACVVLGLAMLSGCSQGEATRSRVESHEGHEHGHDHPANGPHDGELIELGDGAYHAEIVHHEEQNAVWIYLLDETAKEPIRIDSEAVTINVTRDGGGEQFALIAQPQENDDQGTSSLFVGTEPALVDALHAGDAAQLVVTIEGSQFRGAIEHDEHEHSHGSDH